ncbi:CBS domain-containing protein [Amycolatopsis mongoliensis]|uniref:CBS domain-containing protein n=1 Tax=Amycolatopsis mongoliensis TaxID=715475 RepID=A0A9Y2NE23_9PSEU|nr:CBS domain-containing protein [Amycolatopsis sp. 4-36]WIX98243.1 CBS domain-containing protein [Amycolatopsis sp. 4-36]
MRAREIMSTPTIAVTPAATLREAATVMFARGFTSLPVIDPDGRLLGVLSDVDVLRELCRAGAPDSGSALEGWTRTAGSAMGPGPAVAASTRVHDLANRMAELGTRSLPVVEEGLVVGMVTLRDVLAALTGAHERLRPTARRRL